MAFTHSYLRLQQQIADELGDRQDLRVPLSDSGLVQSPIQNAIQSAIALWEDEPFYFNEVYEVGAFSTVAGQELYTTTDVPEFADLVNIPKLGVTVNNNRYTLTARTWQYLEDISTNPATQTSIPFDYAFWAGTMRFYPTPAAIIPVTLMANKRLTHLSADDDVNAWTTEAYDLIRCQAKKILAQEVLFDDDLATRMDMAIYGNHNPMAGPITWGYLSNLRASGSRQNGSGRIRPTSF
jgi:hypothetical protein